MVTILDKFYFSIFIDYNVLVRYFKLSIKIWESLTELYARYRAYNSLLGKHGLCPVFVYNGSIYC